MILIDNVKIFDNERFFFKRIISEMLNIQLQENGLNYQTDTEYLQYTYTSILNRLKHINVYKL